MKKIRVLIADDHLMVLEGIKELFSKEEDIDVVAEARDGQDAIQKARKTKPDVMCIDISMPVINGLDVIQLVKPLLPDTKILVLTMSHKEPYIRQALEFGALGYILKTSSSSALIQAVRMVSKGEFCLSTEISGTVIKSYLNTREQGPKVVNSFDLLSGREKQVFRMLVKGQGTKTIADILNISPKTVAKHKSHIMGKMKAGDLVSLMKIALKHDVIDAEELAET